MEESALPANVNEQRSLERLLGGVKDDDTNYIQELSKCTEDQVRDSIKVALKRRNL